jgi:DNA-binding XRE family transcriptional regulator
VVKLIDLEMKQAYFAKDVGNNRAQISLIEKGLVLPTMEVFRNILDWRRRGLRIGF